MPHPHRRADDVAPYLASPLLRVHRGVSNRNAVDMGPQAKAPPYLTNVSRITLPVSREANITIHPLRRVQVSFLAPAHSQIFVKKVVDSKRGTVTLL